MQDPSAAWRVPFSPRLFPDSTAVARWLAESPQDAGRAIAATQQQSGPGVEQRHACGVALLCADLPFAAWTLLAQLVDEARPRGGGPLDEHLRFDDDPVLRALHVDLATAAVRCGFWDHALRTLVEVTSGITEAEELAELVHRGEGLTEAVNSQRRNHSFHRRRVAWFEELADHGEATSTHRLQQAKSLLALGEIDHSLSRFDAAAELLIALDEDEEIRDVAVEMLVNLHLRVGARTPEERERARRRLHRLRPNSAVLRVGASYDEVDRMMRGMEAQQASRVLFALSEKHGDAEGGAEVRERMLLVARAHGDQPRCAVTAALAFLARGQRTRAEAALRLTRAPLSDDDLTELAAHGLTVVPAARSRKAAG
ncbi:hypothetical protein OIB37_03315 [Streptomyces sp. NBC_00820]|uniref:hypothetical protein n=1 Tax=Streptomyces sp. NBC_00820 TaxID=2975842 RepID=UPI002ED19D33|nr:hypothetical protein OIB37_03315 [Streptomyces sp. NBC_00820]